ncbi:MAG: hypothetical protein P8J87_15940, partial [Verrucomicrobiales bacterium]|nr:hypothetical protein [Verrucomicrobiales bacterium]
SDGKFLLFPWDMDFTFSGPSRATGNGELNKLLTDPANKHAYYGHLRDIIDTTFNTGYMTRWAQHYSCFLPTENLTAFLNQISNGATNISNAINSAVANVPYRLTTGDGQSTADSFFTVQGDGWVDVREIRVAGVPDPIALVWVDDNTWQAQLPVLPGANTVTLEAYNLQGQLVGSDTITFTGTGTVAPASAANLVISEIMYHPASPDAAEIAAGFNDQDDFEYLELMNISETTSLTLTGLDFTNGINFALGAATIPPGGRALLVANLAAFQFRYGPDLPVVGTYQTSGNKLSNSGERLTLKDAVSAAIKDFTYNDKSPWPESADGDGHSLVLLCPHLNPDHNLPQNWQPSVRLNGSPGTAGTQSYSDWANANGITGSPTDDDDLDGRNNLIDYTLGDSPWPSGSISTSGKLTLTVTRNLSAEIVITPQVSPDLQTWLSGAPAAEKISSTNHGDGTITEVYLNTTATTPAQPGFMRLHIELKQ